MKLAFDFYCGKFYRRNMNRHGTIVDMTRWAEECMPGEESRARSVMVTLRKAGLWSYGKAGPRGRSAATMMVTDFATAICAVLHPGASTKADEAVQRLWSLPLASVTVDRAGGEGEFSFDPSDAGFHISEEVLSPYLDLFKIQLNGLNANTTWRAGDNLISVLTGLFCNFAPHWDFGFYDSIELETAGDKLAVHVHLHGPKHGTQLDGWPGEGIESGAVHLTFGDLIVYDHRAVRTTRTLGSDALNALSLMVPNLSKGDSA